jgi:hypothetical protein
VTETGGAVDSELSHSTPAEFPKLLQHVDSSLVTPHPNHYRISTEVAILEASTYILVVSSLFKNNTDMISDISGKSTARGIGQRFFITVQTNYYKLETGRLMLVNK